MIYRITFTLITPQKVINSCRAEVPSIHVSNKDEAVELLISALSTSWPSSCLGEVIEIKK
jgi:hypothetical protein